MFHAVRHGRLITAHLPSGDQVEGYLSGADDYHWVLFTRDNHTVLIHKSNPAVMISNVRTYHSEDEDLARMIEEATSAYRAFLLSERTSDSKPLRSA